MMGRSLRSRLGHPWLILACAAAVTAGGGSARAENGAAAETLFEEGKRLSAAGKWVEACVKFDESQRLDPGIGTLFQLANCHQRVAKTASAWAEFLEVASQARAAGQAAREQAARARAAALESKLARLTIVVMAPDTPALTITRNGANIGPGQWGTAIPVDPGPQEVVASAPGKHPWRNTVQVGEALSVGAHVPALVDETLMAAAVPSTTQSQALREEVPTVGTPDPAPNITSLPAVPHSRRSDGSGQKIAAGVVMGTGTAGLAVGTIFGFMSKSARDDSADHCRGDRCDATGVSLRDDARQNGTMSTVAFGVGAAAVITGAVLWLTAPSRSDELGSRRPPSIAASPSGAFFGGEF